MFATRWMRLIPAAGLLVLCAAPLRAADETEVVKIKDITLKVPRSWEQQEPSNRLRLAQFAIPAAKGEKEPVELSIFSFGGGTVKANVERWVSQFSAEGRKVKLTRGKSPQGEYFFVDLRGTYNMPVGPPVLRKTQAVPDARMLAVILIAENKDVYYLKLAGPEKTVSSAADAFRKSFGGDADKEEEYDLKSGS